MVNWQGRKVLVAGGAGFIGSNLVGRLLELGSEVSIADNFCRGKMENIEIYRDRVALKKVDLTDPVNCNSVVRDIDYVFHLASSVGGIDYLAREKVENLTPSIRINANMLEAAARNEVEGFLFASSACVYREKDMGLNQFREEDAFPADPATTYGWAKILGEVQCRAYHDDYGLKTSCARIFNVYGENENLDPKWSHVIPSLIRKALLYPREGFTILGDGRQERAFLYVKDCIEGLVRIVEAIDDGSAVNLGGTEVVSIRELAERIIQISGKPINAEYDVKGPQGTHRYYADLSRMKALLNWVPQTSLDQGLENTFRWARRMLNQ
jgi:nucleoside-diphosphate-sugar epimerase